MVNNIIFQGVMGISWLCTSHSRVTAQLSFAKNPGNLSQIMKWKDQAQYPCTRSCILCPSSMFMNACIHDFFPHTSDKNKAECATLPCYQPAHGGWKCPLNCGQKSVGEAIKKCLLKTLGCQPCYLVPCLPSKSLTRCVQYADSHLFWASSCVQTVLFS